MDLGVRDKAFVIVGGTAGMGLAAAQVLAADGARIVVVGRTAERADNAVAALRVAGATSADAVLADVSSPGAAAEAVDEAATRLGGLDGIAVTTGLLGHEPIEVDDERWATFFNDVLLGTVRSVQAALPHLQRGGGTIVTTAAYSIRAPELARLPYGALKSGVATFTKGIAKAYGPAGIRANCICPGAIETEGMARLRAQIAADRGIPLEGALEKVMVEEWHLDVALRRPGKANEVGDLVGFLLSPRAGYLTGALINIDGGTNF